ncbi:hypothetical protein [Novosphingobium sp.]|uniref:hypothetical protein n=1 Tax=Novosphingobium sp. TaxID=1874826 RepID=UPI001EBE00A5|nr:hypothetical protein [Novosphingobium sp.]MBK6801762.1 hypothetical protein [Novosphingobium sp.]MBK9010396.1 hypothetical protein [Novosphingobium sp.]
MKRQLIALAAASLLLGGCSGGETPAEPDADAAAATPEAADKEGEDGAKAKPNPWASDTPPLPAEAPKEDEAKPEEAKPKVNPWAKDPPPGAAASEAAKPD